MTPKAIPLTLSEAHAGWPHSLHPTLELAKCRQRYLQGRAPRPAASAYMAAAFTLTYPETCKMLATVPRG